MSRTPPKQVEAIVPRHPDRRQQFLVFRSGSDPGVADGCETRLSVGGFEVCLFPGASFQRLVDREGGLVGIFLGRPVDYRRGVVPAGELTIDLPHDLAAEARADRVERFAFELGGRWALLHADGRVSRFYLDADGCQSAVYDPDEQRVASTTGLLLDDDAYLSRLDRELYDFLGVEDAGWFPSGLTAHHGIRRLLCNHFLDLDRWETVRHWPREDFVWASDTRDHAVRIAEIARRCSQTLLEDGEGVVSLTAGNESRFLLASCRDLAGALEFVTVAMPDAELDVHRARELAGRFDLRHRVLPAVRATADEARAWRYGVGHCVGGTNRDYHPSIRPLASRGFFLGGLGGEIGRAFFWRPTDDEKTRVDARGIAARFGMPMHERVIEETGTWLATVRDFNPLTQLDLAYLELRMSAWAFAQAYPQDAIVSHLNPLICREAYQLMLELSPSAKRGNQFILEGIGALWPELLALPINRFGDYRDVTRLVRRAASPRRVVKKLRKLFW